MAKAKLPARPTPLAMDKFTTEYWNPYANWNLFIQIS